MRSRGRNINSKINSEIHASLHRLEDANYVNNMIQAENTELLINQTNEATGSLQSQIDDLSGEVYKLHEYIEPHMYQGDLQLFQTLWVGNLQIDDGGKFGGSFSFTDDVSFEGDVTMDGALQVAERLESSTEILAPYIIFEDDGIPYEPHTLTVDGTELSETILASGDISFSLAGLVEGVGTGGTTSLTIRTKNNHTTLLSLTVEPHINYDSDNKKFYAWATVKEGNVLLLTTGRTDMNAPALWQVADHKGVFKYSSSLGAYKHLRDDSPSTSGEVDLYW